LGVDAIVTGTLEDQSNGNVEVSARLIKTESFEILAASTQEVEKTWQDQPSAENPVDSSAPEPRSLGGLRRRGAR
jgi:hypothetical protein